MGRGLGTRSSAAGRLAGAIVASMVLGGLAGCERTKTKLDREVDRLCAIDGGVHIYETVTLAKENFGPDGSVFPQYRHLFLARGHLGPEFIPVSETALLVEGDPALQRDRIAVVRKRDGKVLGEFINYKRSGGDLPGPWEPSRKSCPQLAEANTLYGRVFLMEK